MSDNSARLLRASAPESISVERDGVFVEYSLVTHAPSCGLPPKAADVRTQLRNHGLCVESISNAMNRWVRRWADEVDLVALNYSGMGFSLCVLLPDLCQERIQRIMESARQLNSLFAPYSPTVYIVGPQQQGSILFSEAEERLLYPPKVGP